MNNQTRSHYREHTRQQDGWTVLAPSPGNEPTRDLPPPYTPEAAPAPAPVAVTGTTLAFEIPINSNVVAATLVTRTKNYGLDVPFATGYMEICGIMGLDPATASLGYKWDKESSTTPIHGLSNAADWKACLESGIKQTERARTRQVACRIKNLNLPEEAAPAGTTTRKRKSTAASSELPDGKKTFEYTKEFRELKAHLSCAKHKDQLCYVSPLDGHHQHVGTHEASLWAKEISVNHATIKRPPENIVFQDFFLPERKRTRTTKSESVRSESASTSCAPTIHVTVNTGSTSGGSITTPPRRSPLGTITAASANADNIDAPSSLFHTAPQSQIFDDAGNSESIRYPPVTDILKIIDESTIFEDSAVLTFPAMVFDHALQWEFGITHVNQVPNVDSAFYVHQLGMPLELAELFIEESVSAMGRAEKGKGPA
ncbi:hypothetical protein C8R43DRAFT_1162226 [Mycena crocata]|nr:hypothetical protein C8R43DRAFT_1162226 [Mycena crocata]